MTAGYWNQPEKNAATFVDGWMRTGDKFGRDPDGCYVHHGRMDDMLKVSGLWVSPGEVEAALTAHEAVVEAAVIGVPDAVGLVKVKAYVVPRTGAEAGPELAEDLKQFVRARLLPHKYPRLIEFIDALPRTATGKIRRHILREWARGATSP
jgi:acyl-coenzyme A synthetase/AMP-(fatty) acid ligase